MMDFSVKKEDIDHAREDSKVKHFFTSLQHLDSHFGIRKGVYSVIMGTPSCGKSGLAKLYGIQASCTPHTKVLFWLSEESKAKYAVGMDLYCEQMGIDLGQIAFFEEKSINKDLVRTHKTFLGYFKEVVCASGADLVIIDNITSSRFYGPATTLKEQGETVEFFKEFSHDLDIGLVVVMHTSSDVSDNMGRLFTTEDVRGLKSISIEAAYFYALQKFTRNGEVYTFLRTLKHRFHQQASGTFLLKYDSKFAMYVGDNKVDFNKVKEIFNESDRLKR
jgi:hypothetical protein